MAEAQVTEGVRESTPAPAQLDVAVLVLNWRHADQTIECLQRLREAGMTGAKVLVLDNGSGSEQEVQLREFIAPGPEELRLLRANLGYCAAMNEGLAWARDLNAHYVLFLNNDVEVKPGFLQPLVQVLDNDANIAGVMPTVLRTDGKVWCQRGRIGFYPNLTSLHGQGKRPAPVTDGPSAVDFLPGACALYRMDDLQSVGRLDDDYFMYVEDLDLCRRLTKAGRVLLWLPWVSVVHHPSSSSGGGRSPLRKYMSAVNSWRFLRRHGSLRLWLAFLLLDVLLLPLAFAGGRRAGWAKMRGLFDGAIGHKLDEDDVGRWVSLEQ